VDGRNPAPVDSVDRWFIPLFIGFRPSKVVQDFATIHSMFEIYGKKNLSCFVMFWQQRYSMIFSNQAHWAAPWTNQVSVGKDRHQARAEIQMLIGFLWVWYSHWLVNMKHHIYII
jgi:hypothetical protein